LPLFKYAKLRNVLCYCYNKSLIDFYGTINTLKYSYASFANRNFEADMMLRLSCSTWSCFAGLSLILIACTLFILTFYGHFYRYPIDQQTLTFNDGLKEYSFARAKQDTFSIEFYEQTYSINDAVIYINKHYKPITQEEKLIATFNFTSKRFMHFMYPHHTWVTNLWLAFSEFLFPKKPFNGMYLADDLLRHSAVAPCAGAANVFIEIYRALNGHAQLIHFSGAGHTIVEVRIGNQFYFVDANLERLKKGKVKDISSSENIIREIYSGYSKNKIDSLIKIFKSKSTYFGYNSSAADSPRIQKVQYILSWLKWFIPFLLFYFGYKLINTRKL